MGHYYGFIKFEFNNITLIRKIILSEGGLSDYITKCILKYIC